MKKKPFVALALGLIVSCLFLSPVMAAEVPLKVGLVLNGFLGDRSFNDAVYGGLERAMIDFGVDLKVMESRSPADWEANLVAMAASGYDLLLACGVEIAEIIGSRAAEFPDVKFGVIDSAVRAPNVRSIVFAQNEGSFLAGAAAALFTTHDEIDGVNDGKVIGWVGGMDIATLRDFLAGYEQGARFIDAEMDVLVSFADTFDDPLKGRELALAQYERGADIIMNVAANTGNGVLQAASETGRYAIGVDLDQDGIYPGHILTSMVKRLDLASYQLVRDAVEGAFQGDSVVEMGLASGGVALTDMAVMREALGDQFPRDLLERIDELAEQIKSGAIEVDVYEGLRRD